MMWSASSRCVNRARAIRLGIKPLLGTLEYGLPHRNLVKGIAAAMHFRSEDDPQAQELAALIAEKGHRPRWRRFPVWMRQAL